MKKSIIVAGVGGQGVITAANIIAKAALEEGYNVVTSELHGMAQRGGNVECNVRIGDVLSPIAASGTADAILSFEPLEALRNLNKVRKDGIVLTDINPIFPPLVSAGIGKYPSLDEIFEKISESCRLIKINADEIARKAGSILTKNIVMIGCLHSLEILPIKEESYIEAIKGSIKKKYVEMNIRAFKMGKEEIKIMEK